jgi:hypothetical protein
MIIRKLSVGVDYKSSMNYITGQSVLNGNYVIHLIKITDAGSYQIFIEQNKEVVLWKEISSSVPVSVEYNIEF